MTPDCGMPEEEQARIDLLAGLCRDHNFRLFKMDAVCGRLRDDKQPAFIRLMQGSASTSARRNLM